MEGLGRTGRARRLAALKLLGIKTVNVWVRSGISDRLGQLLAEQDENVLHKPLTQLEAAALYRELKTLLAEDAARRQEATRFQTTADDAEDGGANLAPPQIEQGKTRAQAARMVTGRASYTTLERIGRLEDLAADESQPEAVRARAAQEIERIKTGGSVYPSHLRVNAELSLAELDQLAADRDHRQPGLWMHQHLAPPDSGQQTDLRGADDRPGPHGDVTGLDVVTDPTHVVAGANRLEHLDLRAAAVGAVQRQDRIGQRRQRCAGVDAYGLPRLQPGRRSRTRDHLADDRQGQVDEFAVVVTHIGTGVGDVDTAHRVAVDRGLVESGKGALGDHVFGAQ